MLKLMADCIHCLIVFLRYWSRKTRFTSKLLSLSLLRFRRRRTPHRAGDGVQRVGSASLVTSGGGFQFESEVNLDLLSSLRLHRNHVGHSDKWIGWSWGVNTRQQTERDIKREKRKLGTIEHMCQVVKQEGWERLYGGLAPSLAGTAASQTFLLGAVAKLGATVTTYPLLAVKSRLQAKQLRLVIAPCSEKALALDS
ncbi:hypothetical protein DY000_02061582 [Brassica cretica]|uniref:Uncharacterized protein n=1 Tax=Brassica cretica TaxID=69181 RepID=A0ABQ7ANE3_BRACR|nr:hypothetical protein DY000_02061582 [Brassica cretica]